MKYMLIALLLCCSTVFSQVPNGKVGRKHSLYWEKPVLNEDGTPLTDLAGYTVGIFPSDVPLVNGAIAEGTTALATVDILDPNVSVSFLGLMAASALGSGTYTFAVLAYDTFENESEWSEHLVLEVKVVRPGRLIINVRKD
jgi:hypothetical protein